MMGVLFKVILFLLCLFSGYVNASTVHALVQGLEVKDLELVSCYLFSGSGAVSLGIHMFTLKGE